MAPEITLGITAIIVPSTWRGQNSGKSMLYIPQKISVSVKYFDYREFHLKVILAGKE
jgi:hypothetical protein